MPATPRHPSVRRPDDRHRSWRIPFVLLLVLLVAPPLLAQGKTLASGQWTKKGFDIEGSWSIVEDGGRRFVVLDDAFRTKSAPDLKIFLSSRPAQEISSLDATRGAVRVGPLASNKGAQRLEIPAGVDLGSHPTLVLHCEQYSKLWGVATIRLR